MIDQLCEKCEKDTKFSKCLVNDPLARIILRLIDSSSDSAVLIRCAELLKIVSINSEESQDQLIRIGATDVFLRKLGIFIRDEEMRKDMEDVKDSTTTTTTIQSSHHLDLVSSISKLAWVLGKLYHRQESVRTRCLREPWFIRVILIM